MRPDKRMGETAQLTLLEHLRIEPIYIEDHRSTKLPERKDAIASLRQNDELWVSHLHRLGTGQGDLSSTIQAVISKGAAIVEAYTGRRSDDPVSLVAMITDANGFYGRTLDPERAREIGKLGAAASPMTKRRGGRMPIKDALRILNDHKRFPTLDAALKEINRHKQYKRPWNIAVIYRLKRDGVKIKDRQ